MQQPKVLQRPLRVGKTRGAVVSDAPALLADTGPAPSYAIIGF